MALYDILPKYYQIEANNLKALQPGFVVAQMPVKANESFLQEKFNVKDSTSTTVGTKVANGHVVSLTSEGIVNAVSTSPLFLVYNDPIVTFGPKRHYAFYATDIEEECLRLVQLMPGDEWMSDMDLLSDDSAYPGKAALSGRIVEITSSGTSNIYNSDDFFARSNLADGTTAHHYMFIK